MRRPTKRITNPITPCTGFRSSRNGDASPMKSNWTTISVKVGFGIDPRCGSLEAESVASGDVRVLGGRELRNVRGWRRRRDRTGVFLILSHVARQINTVFKQMAIRFLGKE